jgi:hypothetical protein
MLHSRSHTGTVSKTGFDAPAMKCGLGLHVRNHGVMSAEDILTGFQELVYGIVPQTEMLAR